MERHGTRRDTGHPDFETWIEYCKWTRGTSGGTDTKTMDTGGLDTGIWTHSNTGTVVTGPEGPWTLEASALGT